MRLTSPCQDCKERLPTCHDVTKCEKWAAFQADKEKRKQYLNKTYGADIGTDVLRRNVNRKGINPHRGGWR